MPSNWIEFSLALTLALLAAGLVADLAGRGVAAMLGGIATSDQPSLVRRPKRIVQLSVFLIAAAAFSFPALTLAGYDTAFTADRDAVLRWLLDGGLRIALIAVVGYLVIRVGTATAQRFEASMSTGSGLDVLERTKRAQTLGRLVQKTLTVVVVAVGGLMILTELEVDIMPVLTGAGILGLAVGFGAQTLVRDVISGFFLILEDQVRVGDVAVVNGTGGLVEKINLRTIVLRDLEGTVHVFPNGAISSLSNKTKDFSYFVLDVPMAYGEDPDRVAAALKEIAGELQAHEQFRPNILEPLEVLGVDNFGDSQVTLRVRMKTVPLKQWEVGREFRRRITYGFKARGIEIPFPQRTLWIRERTAPGDASGSGGSDTVPVP